MAHSASHRRDHHQHDDGATSLVYKDRDHWPRLKFRLEMHFDSRGLQGLIVRGLIDRPVGGFITRNINPTTMSVININNTGADGTARGFFVGTVTGVTQVGDRGDPQLIQVADGVGAGAASSQSQVADGTDAGAASRQAQPHQQHHQSQVADGMEAGAASLQSQVADGTEAGAASPQDQLAALTELATQLQSDTNGALDGEAQQEIQQGINAQLQAIQKGIIALNIQSIAININAGGMEAAAAHQQRHQHQRARHGSRGRTTTTGTTTKADQGKADITKEEPSDSSSSSDEEVDWFAIYKKAKYKAKKQLKQQRNKGAANSAWYEKATKIKKAKKRSKR